LRWRNFSPNGRYAAANRGRNQHSNHVFTANRKPVLDKSVRIAVLIDGGSASASEIVSGIVQDLDRGIVVGTPSFGKGLVQTVFRVSKQHSVKITTAKYYIPSGRLIQKPGYIKNPKLIADEAPQDSIFFSRNHRLMKSKGGITPDILVKNADQSEFVTDLWRQNQFYTFAVKYKTENRRIPNEIDDEILAVFSNYITQSGFKFVTKNEQKIREMEKTIAADDRLKAVPLNLQPVYAVFDSLRSLEFNANRQPIRRAIESQFAMLEGGIAGQVKADLKYDEVISTATQLLSDVAEYRTTLGYAK
jgi:carboxyl-terminal processing protease